MKNNPTVLLLFILMAQCSACKKDKAVADPTPGPIAAYNFDNDWVTNSVSGLLHGSGVGNISSTTDSFKTTYAALMFSQDGYVEVKDSDLLDFVGGQFTLTAWICPLKTDGTYVVHKSDAAGAGGPYALEIHPGFVEGYVRTTTNETFIIKGTSKILKNVWQHVAVTFTGEQLTVYYNGKSEGAIAVDRPMATSTGTLEIGAYAWAFPAACFSGKIDNVRIFDKALTAGQINTLYKNYKQ